MSLNLGTLHIRIRPDMGGTLGAVKQLENRVSGLAALGSRLSFKVTAPIAAAAAGAVQAFAAFDDAMTSSLAIYGKTTDTIRKQMESTARAISERSRTGAVEVAKGYGVLISAGFSLEQSMKAIATAERFAVAGFMQLETATTLLAQSQFALGLASEDPIRNMQQMNRVADVLSMANAKASGTIEQFARALASKGAPALRSANKSLEEGVAALMVYAERGRHAEIAGELLNVTLRELDSVSRKFSASWRRFGVAIYDSRGQMRKLWDILGDMEKRLQGLSPQARAATLAFLGFTDLSSTAIKTLLGTSGRMKEFYDDLANASGKTMQIAEDRLKSFKAQMLITWHQIQGVGIDVGRVLAPAIGDLNTHLRHSITLWKSLADAQKVFVTWGVVAVGSLPVVAIGAALSVRYLGRTLTGLGLIGKAAILPVRAALWSLSVALSAATAVGRPLASLFEKTFRAARLGAASLPAAAVATKKFWKDSAEAAHAAHLSIARSAARQAKNNRIRHGVDTMTADMKNRVASHFAGVDSARMYRAARRYYGEFERGVADAFGPITRRAKSLWSELEILYYRYDLVAKTYGARGVWHMLKRDVESAISPLRRLGGAMLSQLDVYRRLAAVGGFRLFSAGIRQDVVAGAWRAARSVRSAVASMLSAEDRSRLRRSWGEVAESGTAAWAGISLAATRAGAAMRRAVAGGRAWASVGAAFRSLWGAAKTGLMSPLTRGVGPGAAMPVGPFGRMIATIRRDAAKFKADVKDAFGGGVDVSWVLPAFRGVWTEIKRGAAEAARSTRLFDFEFMRIARDIPTYLAQIQASFGGVGKTIRMGAIEALHSFGGTSRKMSGWFGDAVVGMKQKWRDFASGLRLAPAWNSHTGAYKLGGALNAALSKVGDSINWTAKLGSKLRHPFSTAALEWNRRVFRPLIRPVWVPFKREWLRPVIMPVLRFGKAFAKFGALAALTTISVPLKVAAWPVQRILWPLSKGIAAMAVGGGITVGAKLANGFRTASVHGVNAMRTGFLRISTFASHSALNVKRAFSAAFSGVTASLGALASIAGGAATAWLSNVSSGLSLISAIATAASALVSWPVLLVVAGAAFVEFTDIGKRAFDSVAKYARPAVDAIKKSFWGVKDAVKAGDLRLAADIAFTGVKLAALNTFIEVYGTADTAMSRIVRRLLAGDLRTAWDMSLVQIKLAAESAWTEIQTMFHNGVSAASKYLGVDLYAAFENLKLGLGFVVEKGREFGLWILQTLESSPRLSKAIIVFGAVALSGLGNAAVVATTAVAGLLSKIASFPGGGVALATAAIGALVFEFTGARKAAADLNDQLQKTVDLNNKLAAAKADATDKTIKRITSAGSAEDQKKQLEEELKVAQNNMSGVEARLEAARAKHARVVREASSSSTATATDAYRSAAGHKDSSAALARDVQQEEQIYQSAQQRVRKLQEAIDGVAADHAAAANQAQQAAAAANQAQQAQQAAALQSQAELDAAQTDLQDRHKKLIAAAAHMADDAIAKEEELSEQTLGLKDNLEDIDGKAYNAHVGVTGINSSEALAWAWFSRLNAMREKFNKGKVKLPAAPVTAGAPLPASPQAGIPQGPAAVISSTAGMGAAAAGNAIAAIPSPPASPKIKTPAVMHTLDDARTRDIEMKIPSFASEGTKSALREAEDANRAAAFGLESAQDAMTKASRAWLDATHAADTAVGAAKAGAMKAMEEAAATAVKAERDLEEAKALADKRSAEAADVRKKAEAESQAAVIPGAAALPEGKTGNKLIDQLIKRRDGLQRIIENKTDKTGDVHAADAEKKKKELLDTQIRRAQIKAEGKLKPGPKVGTPDAGAPAAGGTIGDAFMQTPNVPEGSDVGPTGLFNGGYLNELYGIPEPSVVPTPDVAPPPELFGADYLNQLYGDQPMSTAMPTPAPLLAATLDADMLEVMQTIAANTAKQIVIQTAEV